MVNESGCNEGVPVDIYLMQHGVATSAEDDPARPLTPSGRGDVERVARRAAAAGVRVARCVHSGKLRAEQTAGIIGRTLGARVESQAGLNPSDPVQPVADWLSAEASAQPDGAIAIVGHLPFLDRLASLLVVGHQEAQPIHFRNAGLVKLVPRPDASGFAVAWILTPDLAGEGGLR